MANEVTTQQTKALVTKEDLKNYLSTFPQYDKFDNFQISTFLKVAELYQLNPFKKEIYALPFWNKDKNKYDLMIHIGYETYLKQAYQTGLLKGWYLKREKIDNVMNVKVVIKRKDFDEAFEYAMSLDDLPNTTKAGSGFKTSPLYMLEKTVISRAFRFCFADVLGGLQEYNVDETPAPVEIQDGTGVVVDSKPSMADLLKGGK